MNSDVLRTSKTLADYRAERQRIGADALSKVDLTDLPMVHQWHHWILVVNEFPYDKIASVHRLLVPLRRFIDESQMTNEEREELFRIKEEFAQHTEYDCLLENLRSNRTVPGQYHLHCIKFHHVTPITDLS